jgi:hypothetical protein
MESALRSRRLLYRARVPGEALTEEEFTVCFERALAKGMKRVGITGDNLWIGKAVGHGQDDRVGTRSRRPGTFTEYEVYLLLPEAVRPGMVRGWLALGRFGWSVDERARGPKESGSKFFAKPLKEWNQPNSVGKLLGRGFTGLAGGDPVVVGKPTVVPDEESRKEDEDTIVEQNR